MEYFVLVYPILHIYAMRGAQNVHSTFYTDYKNIIEAIKT